MYDDEAMRKRLVKGDVGEALFRYWFEENVGSLTNLRLLHWGYFPFGIVKDEEKRKLLKKQSDPDYAIVNRKDESKPILGVSVNAQAHPYDIHSTMGGDCVKCPRSLSCYDRKEENMWFNAFNIKNDYVKFSNQNSARVVLAVLLVSSIATVAAWVSANDLARVVHDYVQGGPEAVEDKKGLADFLAKLGARDRVKQFLWLWHQEVLDGKTRSFITGGWSNFGRPRPVYCVDMKLAMSPDQFVNSVRNMDRRGA
jgi:hypothetical protein